MKQLRRLQSNWNSEKRISLIMAISLGIFMLAPGLVVSEVPDTLPNDTSIFFQSKFILWDQHEKMINKEFNITLITFNNQSHVYSIILDDIVYNGTYVNYTTIEIMFNYSQINNLLILIDNILILEADDIRVISGVSRDSISNLVHTYKIEFLPFELTKFEWNLIYSGLVGVFICLPTAYFTVKWYRRYRGAQEV